MVTKEVHDECLARVREQNKQLKLFTKQKEKYEGDIKFLKQQVEEIKRIAEEQGGQMAVVKKRCIMLEELLKKNHIDFGEETW